MTIFTPVQKASAQMLVKHPFYSTLLMNTPLVATEDFPRAATDMKSIFYNPKFMASLSTAIVIFVLLHELLHIILMHGTRRRGRDPELWNIACDYVVNGILFTSGVPLWEGCYHDKRFHNMSAEQVYEILKQEQDEQPQPDDSEGDEEAPDDEDGSGGGGKPPPGKQPGKGKYRSKEQPTGWDIIEPDTGDEPGAAEKLEQEIASKVAFAAQAARMMGVMPAGLDLIIKEMVFPPVPWEELLREYMKAVVRDGQTWMRKNRRFYDVYLPSPQDVRTGHVVVIGDTSGSMYTDYPRILGGVRGIVDDCDPQKITIVWADTEVARVEEIERGQEFDLHPAGGGGTDMRVPLAYVEELQPDVVILMTDGATPWPDSEPPYPLIVVCTTNCDVPIGETVRI